MEKHPGAIFSLFGVFVSFCLFASGVLSDLDSTLTSLIYQLGYQEKETQKGIWILKKDEKTSGLIGKAISRRDYASILRQIGTRKTMKVMSEDERNLIQQYKFVDLKVGYIEKGENGLFSIPLYDGDSEESNPEGRGFVAFSENVGRLFREFFEFPAISSGTFFDFNRGKNSFLTPELMLKTERFFRKILQSFVTVTLRVSPKKNVIVQVYFQMNIDESMHFEVPPAKVIGWDILLQGKREDEEDNLLEQALSSLETPVVLAAQCEIQRTSQSARQKVNLVEKSGQTSAQLEAENFETTVLLPWDKFLKQRASLGLINVNVVNNGFIEFVPLFTYMPDLDKIMPGFALQMAVTALDKGNPNQEKSFGKAMEGEFRRILPLIKSGTYKGGFQLPDRFIPTDEFGNMYLYFLGSTDSKKMKKHIFPYFSSYEAFDDLGFQYYQGQNSDLGTMSSSAFRQDFCRLNQNYGDRIVLMGTFEKSDFDFFQTPMTVYGPFCIQDQKLAGIEIHANALANILDKRYLKPSKDFFSAILLISSTLLFGLLLDHLSSLAGFLLSLFFLGGIFSYTYFLYHYMAQIFHVSAFLFGYGLTSALTAIVKGIMESHWADAIRPIFQRFVEDINMAKQVQEKLFPASVLEVGDYRVFGVSQPATELGGDYFDYLSFGDQEMLVLLGDVSGHGIAAALVMAMSKAMVSNFAKLKAPPTQLFSNLNQVILDSMKFSALMPLAALYINTKTNEVQLFSFGHPLPYKIDSAGLAHEIECKTSRPLGSMKVFPTLRPNAVQLAPGERFLFYTDGLVESLDTGEEKTGFRFFQDYLQTCPKLPLEQACPEILKNHPFFKQDRPQPDDFTIVIVERKA